MSRVWFYLTHHLPLLGVDHHCGPELVFLESQVGYYLPSTHSTVGSGQLLSQRSWDSLGVGPRIPKFQKVLEPVTRISLELKYNSISPRNL